MSDWGNKLMEKYPELFKNRYLPVTQSCMPWGLECGQGWETLLEALFFQISCCREQRTFDVVVDQVKEKFGSLRFYWHGESTDRKVKEGWVERTQDYIDGLVSMTEQMSYYICELCGNKGKTNETGWISTLCDECREAIRGKS